MFLSTYWKLAALWNMTFYMHACMSSLANWLYIRRVCTALSFAGSDLQGGCVV